MLTTCANSFYSWAYITCTTPASVRAPCSCTWPQTFLSSYRCPNRPPFFFRGFIKKHATHLAALGKATLAIVLLPEVFVGLFFLFLGVVVVGKPGEYVRQRGAVEEQGVPRCIDRRAVSLAAAVHVTFKIWLQTCRLEPSRIAGGLDVRMDLCLVTPGKPVRKSLACAKALRHPVPSKRSRHEEVWPSCKTPDYGQPVGCKSKDAGPFLLNLKGLHHATSRVRAHRRGHSLAKSGKDTHCTCRVNVGILF